MTSVFQPWVLELPWKKQSMLVSAMRGPDTAFCKETKKIVKLIRRTTQFDADTSTDYMRAKEPINFKELERELEYCTLHFISHLLEALDLLTKHTHALAAQEAISILEWFSDTFHLIRVNYGD